MRWLPRIFVVILGLLPVPALADCKGEPVQILPTTAAQAALGVAVAGSTVKLRSPANDRAAYWLSGLDAAVLDLCMKVTVRSEENASQSGGGILFWSNDDATDYYLLRIDSAGNASLGRKHGAEWLSIIKWKPVPALKTGLDVENELGLALDGRTVEVFINGEPFGKATRDVEAPAQQRIALAVYGGDGVSAFDFSGITARLPADNPAQLALDAEMQSLYDALVAIPPLPGDVRQAGLEFVGATGTTVASAVRHGVAEINYRFKPTAGGTENTITFFLYDDEATARRYVDGGAWIAIFRTDAPEGQNRHEVYDPFDPFDHPVDLMYGARATKPLGWAKWAYQQGRVVIVSTTDQTLPRAKKKKTDPIDRVSDDTKERALQLLMIGKYHLDSMRDVKVTTEKLSPGEADGGPAQDPTRQTGKPTAADVGKVH